MYTNISNRDQSNPCREQYKEKVSSENHMSNKYERTGNFFHLAGLKLAINCDDVKVVEAISVYVHWICVCVCTDLSVHVGSESFGNTYTSEVASCACNEDIWASDGMATFILNLDSRRELVVSFRHRPL